VTFVTTEIQASCFRQTSIFFELFVDSSTKWWVGESHALQWWHNMQHFSIWSTFEQYRFSVKVKSFIFTSRTGASINNNFNLIINSTSSNFVYFQYDMVLGLCNNIFNGWYFVVRTMQHNWWLETLQICMFSRWFVKSRF